MNMNHERETNEDPTWVCNARPRPTTPLYGMIWMDYMVVPHDQGWSRELKALPARPAQLPFMGETNLI